MPTDFDRLILDEAPGGVVVTTRKGEVVHWSRGAQLIFGYSAEETVGRALAELIELDDQRGARDKVMYELNDKGINDYECLRRRKDGAPVYIDATSKALYNAAGQIEYILFSKKDITHLKALRDAQQADAKCRELLESTPDAIIMTNASGRIVLANGHAERLFGYAAGALRGQPLEVLLPERYRAGHVGHRSQYFGQPRPRTMGAGLELYGLRRDGVEFPLEISLSPITTDDGTLVMSAIRDTSERRKAEQKFRGLLEAAPDAIVIVNRQGEIVLVNSQTEQLFGYPRAELLGRRIEVLIPQRYAGQHPAHRAAFFEQPRPRAMGAGWSCWACAATAASSPSKSASVRWRWTARRWSPAPSATSARAAASSARCRTRRPSWSAPTRPRTASWPACRTSCARRSTPSSASPSCWPTPAWPSRLSSAANSPTAS